MAKNANADLQSEELLALKSIYDENVLVIDREGDLPSGRFLIQPTVPQPFYIQLVKHDGDQESEEYPRLGNICIEYLPPLTLYFELPDTYPSTTGPAFLLSSKWLTLSQLSSLCSKLDELREESCDVVLFIWFQFLQEESLSFLNIKNTLDVTELLTENRRPLSKTRIKVKENTELLEKSDLYSSQEQCASIPDYCSIAFKPAVNHGSGAVDCRALRDVAVGTNIIPLLLDYNKLKKQESFNNEWYMCEICFNRKQGIKFLVFHGCNHMFCKECMYNYFSIQICNGNANLLTCPETKCSSAALPSQVKEIVGEELYADYDAKLLATTLDSMSDVTYCPRNLCQCPTLIDRENNMAICPYCKFAFCVFCNMSYHGISPCRFKKEERKKIRDEYLNADKIKKKEMEKRYGKRSLQMLVDESLSEDWIDTFSKKCPHCSASIEKSDGCNKMTCWKCGTNFCWLCMTNLKSSNPYTHFSEANSSCFNQLFYGMTIDFEEEEVEFGEFL